MENLRKWFAPIITILMYVIIVIVMAITLNFVFDLDSSFWITSSVGLFLMVAISFIWMPTGIDKGKKVKEFVNNENLFNDRANYIVDNQLINKASQFCEYKNEIRKKQVIKNKLSKVYLDYSFYEKYLNPTKEDKELFKTLNKKQLKKLDNLKNREVRFKKLKVSHLIYSRKVKNDGVPKSNETLFWSLSVAGKAIFGFVLAALLTSLIITQREDFGWAEVIQIIFWGFSIIYNLFMSIYMGYKRITVFRNDYLVEKATLCAEFFEWAEIPLNKVDADKSVEEN